MRRHVIISVIVMSLLMTAAIASAKERVFYYHNDHLGTPQVMTDESGATVWQNDAYPFGKSLPGYPNEDPDGDGAFVVSNIRFPGQYYDSETGLHYNWHRDYQPQTGRYQEADPVGIDQGRNHLYIYVQNNPVIYQDPIGLAHINGMKCDVISETPLPSIGPELLPWNSVFVGRRLICIQVIIDSVFCDCIGDWREWWKDYYQDTAYYDVTYKCCDDCGCTTFTNRESRPRNWEKDRYGRSLGLGTVTKMGFTFGAFDRCTACPLGVGGPM